MTRTRNRILVVASAGLIAVAGTGLYAGVLTTTTSGKVGAGSVELQASCATAAVVAPGEATWNPATSKFEYTTLDVTYTAAADACSGQLVTAVVYKLSDGSSLSTNANAHEITAGESTAKAFSITLDTAVDAAIVATDYKYGLVFQTHAAA